METIDNTATQYVIKVTKVVGNGDGMQHDVICVFIVQICANIQRYYMVQQLIAQLSSVCGETPVKCGRINGGELILSLSYACNCRIINNLLHR